MPAQEKKSQKKDQKNKSASKKDGKNDSSSDSSNKPVKKGASYPPDTAPVKQKIPPKYDAEKRQKEKEKEKEEKEKEQQSEDEEEEEDGGKKKGKKCDLKEKEKKKMEEEIKQLLSRNTKEEQALDQIGSRSNRNKRHGMQMVEYIQICQDCNVPDFSVGGEDSNTVKPMGIGRNIHLQDSVHHDMKLNIPEPPPPPPEDHVNSLIDENYLPAELRNEIEKKRKEAKKACEERNQKAGTSSGSSGSGLGTSGITPSPTDVLVPKYFDHHELEEIVKEKEAEAIKLFEKVFHMYKQTEILMSFNGGKDCTVVLHMYQQFLDRHSHLKDLKIATLYIQDPDAFREVNQFVDDCAIIFNIELIKKPGPIMKALEEVCKERPQLRAVLMGNRRTDPNCENLRIMQPTDPKYPRLMRINPIIEWTCRDVWQYMYYYNVPYCVLYQRGYTSIGNRRNTRRNPYLRVINASTGEIVDYRPGHELLDNDNLERAGRL